MPARNQKPTTPERTPLQERILAAVPPRFESFRPTLRYRLAALAVAAVSCLLPIAYLGLILLVGHGLYWHAKYNGDWVVGGHGRFWFLAYFALFLFGGATLLFMIKALFPGRGRRDKPQNLKRSVEPFLFEYVEAVCRALRAPVPRTIQIDCQPNASAGYRLGFWSMFTRDMTLVIGMPLVCGMTVRQLTGVLAHEFGHFSQGTGMRATYVSRSINDWLLRGALERDWFDEWLHRLMGRAGNFGYALYGAWFFVWLTRQFLFALLWCSHAVSCYMLRQMEFDADRYQTSVVGSQTFTQSFRRLADIGMAHHMAINDLEHFYEEGRLPDDLPALMVSNIPHITPEFRKAIRRMQQEQSTGLFDTHPADRERIAAARDLNLPGAFHISERGEDYPAVVLFHHAASCCRGVTAGFYKSVLEDRFNKSLVHPVDRLIKRREAEFEAGKALDRYFLVHVPIDRPLPLAEDAVEAPEDPADSFAEIKAARAGMQSLLAEYRELVERYNCAVDTLFTTAEALSVMDCGLSVRSAEFDLQDARRDSAEKKHKRARAAVQTLAQRMLPFETAASDRLRIALRLLQVPKVAAKLDGGEQLAEEMRSLIPEAVLISATVAELPSLRILYRRIAVLFSRLGPRTRSNQALIGSIVERLKALHVRLTSIQQQLEGRWYPFDHANDTTTLKDFALPVVPDPMDVGGLMYVTQHAFERLFMLQVRMFARLAHAAERVEGLLRLAPLCDPAAAVESKQASPDAARASEALREPALNVQHRRTAR